MLLVVAVELRVQRKPVGDRAAAGRTSHPQGVAEDPGERARLHRGERPTTLRLIFPPFLLVQWPTPDEPAFLRLREGGLRRFDVLL